MAIRYFLSNLSLVFFKEKSSLKKEKYESISYAMLASVGNCCSNAKFFIMDE